MSARYVWDKYTLLKVFNPSTVSQYSWYDQYAGTSNHLLGYCSTSVEWDNANGKATLKGSIVELRFGKPVDCVAYPYFSYVTSGAVFVLHHPTTMTGNYWFPSATGNNNLVYVTESATSSATKYSFTVYTPEAMQGYFVETVSSNSSSIYPTTSGGAASGDYWYKYKGSDTIDPSTISYTTEKIRPGDSVDVTVTPSASIKYGGTISYLYQYSLNGGSWTDIQTTTATSITFTVPANAKTLRFRVLAKDNMGFTSTSYITGQTITLERLNAWVGVSGKARKGVDLYVGVNGKARKVTAAYIGVNGKARRFL